MSDKKKKPMKKSDIIAIAISLGLGTESELTQLTVKEIRARITLHNQLEEQEPGITTATNPDIPEIIEPNCGHIFRKVREIHRTGNIVVNICNICGWREIVG